MYPVSATAKRTFCRRRSWWGLRFSAKPIKGSRLLEGEVPRHSLKLPGWHHCSSGALAQGTFGHVGGSAAEPDGAGCPLGLDPERGAVQRYPRAKGLFPKVSSAGRKSLGIAELFPLCILGEMKEKHFAVICVKRRSAIMAWLVPGKVA